MSQPAAPRQPIPVGKYFVDRKKITAEQLELALSHRAEFGLKLGQSLVELGLVTEADMVEALRHQARFPCVHLTSGIVDSRIAAKLGEVESRRLRAIALNQIAGHTTVALEDPSDQEALKDLGHILATRILPVYAEPSAIRRCQERVFGPPRGARKSPPGGEPEAHHAAETPHAVPAQAAAARKPDGPLPDVPPDDRAVVDNVRALLQSAFEHGATAIHLEPRTDALLVRSRIGGVLREQARFPVLWAPPTLSCLKALAKLDPAVTGKPQQGSVPFLFRKVHIEVRISTTPTLHGESAVLHVQGGARVHRDLAQLGLFDEQMAVVESILTGRPGMIVVAGPSGSGRKTTFRALMTRLAAGQRKCVALLPHTEPEAPGAVQITLDPAAGIDLVSGTQACLMQDPDVVLVQEGGQREVAQSLLEAALAGRGVITTLRSGGALQTLTSLQSLGLEPYLLAEALRGVVAQRLVRGLCPECSAPIVPDHVLAERLGLPADGATYQEGEGCDACHGTGHRGRFALFEVLAITPGLRRELEKGSGPETLARAAHADGFHDLRSQGLRHARAGRTTLHEILRAIAG